MKSDSFLLCGVVCALLSTGTASAGGPADDVLSAVTRALGVSLSDAQTAELISELEQSAQQLDGFAPFITSLAILSRQAEEPATRIVMDDMMRKLVANVVTSPENSAMVSLVDGANPMLQEIYLGVGVSVRDMNAAVALDALADQLPQTPNMVTIDPARAQVVSASVAQSFASAVPGNQQFIARMDAWAEGVIAAWPDLTEDEQRIAAGVSMSAVVPGLDVVEAVTGSRDLVLWLGGMNLSFTAAERAAHPELMAFLEGGNMTAGATDMIAARLMSGQMSSSVATMMRLNDNLLCGDLSGASVAGDLLGVE